MSLPSSEVTLEVYQQTKFRWDISIGGWDITTSGYEIQTSAILEFYFRFRSRPVRHNLHVILHQATEFRQNRSNHCRNMTSYPFLKIAAATAKYYFRFRICWCCCHQNVKVYRHTKFRRDISIGGWDISTSGFEIQTSAMLEFYFRFRSRSVRRNLHVILHQATEFRSNRSTHCGNMTVISISQDGGRDGWILLPVSYLLMSLPSEGQRLSANQILSIYLNWRLIYNYFQLRNTNVRHIGILLPVSISTISPLLACHSASGCWISSKLEHPPLNYDVIYQFSRWRPSAMLCLLWGNGGPPTKCLLWSEFRPQIASSSD